MKKRLISICITAIMILCLKSVFAEDNESIKSKIRHHKEAIRRLEQQLGSSQGSDYKGAGEGLPDNAGVDRPWEGKADLNNDGTVDKTEKHRWNNRETNKEGDNPPGPKGGPGSGQGKGRDFNKGPKGDKKGFREHGKDMPRGPGHDKGLHKGDTKGVKDHGQGVGKNFDKKHKPEGSKGKPGARSGGKKGKR